MTKPAQAEKPTMTEIVVRVDLVKGDALNGRVQVPADQGLYKFFNQPAHFFVLKTDLGRSLLINKLHVIKIEPQENRSQQ